MPTTSHFLRPLSPSRYQVHIANRVAAVLQLVGQTVQIYILTDKIQLLATCADTVVGTAARIAEGEFDNDFRFEYSMNPEPSSNADLYFISQYATPSQLLIDSFTSEDPGATIEAAREVQAIPDIEERWAMYAERGW